jgi:CO dehydrogenase maturation factor
VVLDTTVKSVQTALRLREIAAEIEVDVKRLMLIANKIPEGAEARIHAAVQTYGLELESIVPYDPLIPEYDAKGIPLMQLPEDAPAVIAIRALVEKIR